jgi:hypothetical protein
MCIDGNSAPLSVRYLNSQLSALWQNAKQCVKYAQHHNGEAHSVNLSSEDYVKHKYQRALAQFHYAGSQQSRSQVKYEDLFFSAAFGEPRLEFIWFVLHFCFILENDVTDTNIAITRLLST